jgi:hypothetical protein
MTITSNGFCLIEIATGAVVAQRVSLPCRIDVPGVGVIALAATLSIDIDAVWTAARAIRAARVPS